MGIPRPFDFLARSRPRLDWCCIAVDVRNFFKGTFKEKIKNFQINGSAAHPAHIKD